MSTRLYVDFSKDSEIEYSLDELLRTLLNAPLYKKPEIGKAPFKPLESSKPDPTSDGIRSLMANIAACYDGTREAYIGFAALVGISDMRRLTLDKYVDICIKSGYIRREHQAIFLLEKGRAYLNDNGIVET